MRKYKFAEEREVEYIKVTKENILMKIKKKEACPVKEHVQKIWDKKKYKYVLKNKRIKNI